MTRLDREQPKPRKLRCDCCNTPVAELRDGHLLIRSRHDREVHLTRWTPEQLERLARELRESAA